MAYYCITSAGIQNVPPVQGVTHSVSLLCNASNSHQMSCHTEMFNDKVSLLVY